MDSSVNKIDWVSYNQPVSPEFFEVKTDPDLTELGGCTKCKKRQAIKVGDNGPECHHCAAGLPDPIKGKTVHCGRNDSCPCGSSRKYKRCHGKRVAPNAS